MELGRLVRVMPPVSVKRHNHVDIILLGSVMSVKMGSS
jgi:hypothetical protein